MNDKARAALAALIRERRLALGMSARELARVAGIDNATVSLIEQQKIAQPKADTLQALATAMEIPLADLYAATDWLPEGELPSLRPYMRAKYEDLPDEALAEVERFVAELTKKHGRGPAKHEDE